MDLLTIRLDDLGQDCIVKNAQGDVFLDLSKTKAEFNQHTNKWELSFLSKRNGRQSSKGQPQLSLSAPQTKEQRDAKVRQHFYGNGIVLWEETSDSVPRYDDKPAYTKSTSSMPNADLPM